MMSFPFGMPITQSLILDLSGAYLIWAPLWRVLIQMGHFFERNVHSRESVHSKKYSICSFFSFIFYCYCIIMDAIFFTVFQSDDMSLSIQFLKLAINFEIPS